VVQIIFLYTPYTSFFYFYCLLSLHQWTVINPITSQHSSSGVAGAAVMTSQSHRHGTYVKRHSLIDLRLVSTDGGQHSDTYSVGGANQSCLQDAHPITLFVAFFIPVDGHQSYYS
jgi:hypothetical protein